MKLTALVLFLTSFSVIASECAKDAKKYCSGVEPGKGQLARCLSDYEGSLTPKCLTELRDYKQNTGKKNPCFEDLAEFCSELPSDPLNYEYCLLRNESRLSPKCSSDFRKKKGNIITRNLCAQDIANVCYSEVAAPEGAVNRCLIRNKSKLSVFCQKSVDKRMAEMRKNNPCFDDTEKLCPTQVKFVDIHDCLSKKLTSLAPLCKTVVMKENEKFKANPCYRDLKTHCLPGLKPQDQHECLNLNDEHLGHACKQYRANEKQKVAKMVQMCEQDRLIFCKLVPFKDGAVKKCLQQNKAKLSKGCQQLL